MELTMKETSLSYLRRTVLDTVYQEQSSEIVVPDSMPDIARIVDVYGMPVVQDKRCENGQLRVSGGVQAGILYVPEDSDTIEVMEAWLPFSVVKSAERSDGCMIEESWIRSMDARMINPRKVSVRANIGMQITQLTPEEFPLAQVEAPDQTLQLRRNVYPVLLPVACTEQDFRVQDELPLPDTVPAIERILKWDLHPTVEESRIIGNKAVFRGDLVVTMLYLGTDGSVNTWVGQLPYSQYAELPGEWPDANVAAYLALTSAQLETDGQIDSRTLLADFGILAQICVIDRVELELTEDAYAVMGTLEPEWQSVSLHPQLDAQHIRQTAELTVPAKAKQVVSVTAYPDRPALRRSRDSIYATSALSGSVMYRDEEGKLCAKPIRGEASCSTSGCEDCRCEPNSRLIGQPSANAAADGLHVSVPLEFTLELYQERAWQNLCGGTVTEQASEKKRPSVIIRRTSGGELWQLAKQLGSTVGAIREANGLSGDLAPEGEILLIPLR